MSKVKIYFLKKNRIFYFTYGAICLLFAIICFFSVAGFGHPSSPYKGKSITYDEVSHIPAGYYYLNTGKYFLNPEHPPLVKTLAALPLLTLKNTVPAEDKQLEIREDGQWNWGSNFLFRLNNKTDLIITLSRSSVILFNSLFLFILTLLLAKLASRRTALIALSLIAFSPLSLAHASLVTMDFMSSVLQMLTIVTFCLAIKALREENKLNWYYIISFAIALSSALLAKFSSIFLLPTILIGGFTYIGLPLINNFKKEPLYKLIAIFVFTFCINLILIGSTYALLMRNMNIEDISTHFTNNWAGHLSPVSSRVLNKMVRLGPLVRGWAEYINGTLIISSVVEKSKSSVYFLGHSYDNRGAGPLYFPFLYLVKLPLGFHLLTIFAIFVCIKSWRKRNFKSVTSTVVKKILTENPLPFILICFIGLYSVMAARSSLQIGIRHILPPIMAFTIFLAYLISYFWTAILYKKVKLSKVTLYLVVVLFITALLTFPDYLPYYNIIGGGTNYGYRAAGDSNYDWGQDLKALKRWQQQNNINFAYVDVFANPFGELKYYLGSVPMKEDYRGSLVPVNSFIAISTNRYVTNLTNDELTDNQKYFLLKPYLFKRIGKSIFIFKTP